LQQGFLEENRKLARKLLCGLAFVQHSKQQGIPVKAATNEMPLAGI
jgi:hypothetical protein